MISVSSVIESVYEILTSSPYTVAVIAGVVIVMSISRKRLSSVPPGPRRYPVIGSLLELRGDDMFYVKLSELREQHGDILYLTMGAVKVFVVFGHDQNKAVLELQKDDFKFRPVWLVEIKTLDLTHGIVWSNGLCNETLRKFAMPALHPGVGDLTLKERVQNEAGYVVKELNNFSGDSSKLRHIFNRAICNINCGIIFGARYEYNDPLFLEVTDLMDQLLQRGGVKNPKNFFPILQHLPENKKTKESKELLQKVKDFIHARVQKAQESFDASNIRSLIDLFIEKQKSGNDEVSEENVIHIVRDLFVAGSENVGIGVLWLVGYMTRHIDVQDKCRKCISDAFDSKHEVGADDMQKLPYVEATMNEVLRFANIAPLSVPHATTEEVRFGEFDIPKDTMVLTHLQSVHMDKDYWDEPETFKPERFIGEDGNICKKEAFYPFSIGPRYCPADRLARMELFVFFCQLLQNFTFQADEEGDVKPLVFTQPGAFVEPAVFSIKVSPTSTTS